MFERFSERARRVVVLAQDEARTLKQGTVGTEHLLLGILALDDGVAGQVLEDVGVRLPEARRRVAHMIGQADHVPVGQIPFTPRAKRVLELALREAVARGRDHVDAEDILLGLIHENGGVAARILGDLGADSSSIAERVRAERGGGAGSAPAPAPAPALGGGYRPGPGLIVAGVLLVALAVGVGVLIGWLIWR
jgi:ATP-dependent Clp protease ATP-binding subunit ClpC